MIITVFDTETTGLKTSSLIPLEKRSKVIELCMLTYDGSIDKLDESYTIEKLFKVPEPLEPIITKITGLKDSDLINENTMEGWIPQIREVIERSDMVVAHNVAYDVAMMNNEFARFGTDPIAWPQKKCTVEESEHIKGYRLKLSQLHEELFGESFEEAHRARPDVEATARCFFKLMEDAGVCLTG